MSRCTYLCFYILYCLMMACRLGRNMQHFLIYHKQIVMLEGIKYEIYVEMRQYNGMIFNKIFKNNFLNE